MLKMVLFEYLQGRPSLAQWHRVVNQKKLLKRQAFLQQAIESDRLGNPLAEDTAKWMPATPGGREELAERIQ